MENSQQSMKIKCKILLISEKKYWILHMLKELNYHKKYDQGILEEIVSMLVVSN